MKKESFSLWGKWLIVWFCICWWMVWVLASVLPSYSSITSFADLKVNDNRITPEHWNYLLQRLDEVVWDLGSRLEAGAADKMPLGAVVAFDPSITTCPPWWETFTGANERFIRGWTTLWAVWWRKNVTLLSKNLPAHQHTLFSNNASSELLSNSASNVWVAYKYYDSTVGQDVQRFQFYTVAKGSSSTSSITVWRSWNPVGATGKSFSIMPPFIVLKYCVKVSYGWGE